MQARADALAEMESALARDRAAIDVEAAQLERLAPLAAAPSSQPVNLRDARQKHAAELLLEWAMNANEVESLTAASARASAREANSPMARELADALANRDRRVNAAVEQLATIDPSMRRAIAAALSNEPTLPPKLRERLTRWGNP